MYIYSNAQSLAVEAFNGAIDDVGHDHQGAQMVTKVLSKTCPGNQTKIKSAQLYFLSQVM